MDAKASSDLFGSAAHLLAAPQLISDQLEKLVIRNKGTFSAAQAESIVEMMGRVAAAEGQPSDAQRQFIGAVQSWLAVPQTLEGTWA